MPSSKVPQDLAISNRAPFLGLLLAFSVALLLAIDPFRLSIVGNDPSFIAKYVQQPFPSQLRFPRDTHSSLQHAQKWFVNGLVGPESLVLDPAGKGPYTGVADGRIMRWDGPDAGWNEFAYTSPNRSGICDPGQPMSHVIRNEHICGRPLGLRFNRKSGDLYIADAYYGLLSVGREGGQAKRLVSEAEDMPLRFTNDLDVASDGTIYFTDSSSKYQRRNFFLLVLSGDDSGRVLKYDPKSNETNVLLKGIQFPNGVALSKDESFLVIAESVPGRLLRHWLKGADAGKTEVMAVLPGYPDNVRMNEEGEFWVAMHCRRSWASSITGALPRLRRALLQLPIPFRQVYRIFNGGDAHGIVAKYDGEGKLLQVLEDVKGDVVKYASQVDETAGYLWVASVLLPYIAVFDLHT